MVLASADRLAYDAELIERLDPVTHGELDLDSDKPPVAQPVRPVEPALPLPSYKSSTVPRAVDRKRLWSRVSAACAGVAVVCAIASLALRRGQATASTPLKANLPAIAPMPADAIVQEANSNQMALASVADGPLETQAAYRLTDHSFRGFAPGSWDPHSDALSPDSATPGAYSADSIKKKCDAAFGIGYRPFLFGMSPEQAGACLKMTVPPWENMPVAGEYKPLEVRYLLQRLKDVPELLPVAGGEFSSECHVVLFFENRRLCRVAVRFVDTPEVPDHRGLLQRFASFNHLATTDDRFLVQCEHVTVAGSQALDEILQVNFIKAGADPMTVNGNTYRLSVASEEVESHDGHPCD